jgi:hypothetical protein
VGPGGEVVLDYSVYDALRAGFSRVVFVIRRAIQAPFEDAILSRFRNRLETACVFQELDALPEGFRVPDGRRKPWGTGHAVLVAADAVREPFAVINADDFYGAASFRALRTFLAGADLPDADANYALVGFRLRNTLSEHGDVARGVCACDAAGNLARIEELTRIRRDAGGGVFNTGADGVRLSLDPDAHVSMNMWGFTPTVFAGLRNRFTAFLTAHGQAPTSEFYLPAAVDGLIRGGQARCRVLDTPSRWFGVTYPEDKPDVVRSIKSLIAAGEYPERLWP